MAIHATESGDARAADSPTRVDGVARSASELIGGPLGAYARIGRSWISPLVVLFLVTTAVFAIGLVQKGPCLDQGYAAQQATKAYDWRRTEVGWNMAVQGWDDRRYAFTHLCYSDVSYLYRERGFAAGQLAYLDNTGQYPALEYPVLTGVVMQVTAWVTQALGDGFAIHDSVLFFALTTLMLFCCALLLVWLMRIIVPDRPWDAMLVALAPTLALDGLINWDLVAVVVATGALVAWSRSRPVLAGVLLGIGVATKFYPLLLLGPLLVLALRSGRMREWGQAAATAGGIWLAVNLPFLLVAPNAWETFWSFNQDRVADLGSLWLALGVGTGSSGTVNTLSLGLFALACLGIAALGLFARQRPRLGQLAFLTVAAFLVFNKVYSPQYVLWLLPLVALARPRWRDWAIWQAAESFYWFAVWLHLANQTVPADGGSDVFYALSVLVRVAATGYLCVQVVRDILAPERDVVRAGGAVDDPIGGPFDEAPDAPWIRRFRPVRPSYGRPGPSAGAGATLEVQR